MKKIKILGLLLAFILALTACSGRANSNESIDSSQNDKIKVVASFYPAYDLVKKIAGDRAQVSNLTQTGSAHGYEPNFEDMKSIVDADILVVNGAGFESWLDKVKTANKDLKILDLSEGIDLIKSLDDHNHDGDNEEEIEHDHDHDLDNKEKHRHEHDHGGNDPHIWLSLKNAGKMLENIRDKFIEIDPSNKDEYTKNYNKFSKEIKDLDEKYSQALEQYKGRSFVVPHEAFAYLAKDYQLNQLALEGINSDSEPNLTRMAEITDLMKKNQIKTIFYEYGKNDRLAQAIASEIDGNVMVLSTLEVIPDELAKKGEDFISLMEMNLKNLVNSFKEI